MICRLSKDKLLDYVLKQVDCFYPDGLNPPKDTLICSLNTALDRLNKCFLNVTLVNYHKDGEVYFDHLHTDQYSQFLYFFSNTIWRDNGDEIFCRKLMGLNRIVSGTFLSYKCEMPSIFLLCHAVGTVIGNAIYDDFLVITQNVTINTSDSRGDNKRPKLGKGVFLGAGAKIIGSPKIGDFVSIGANSYIYNMDVDSDFISYYKDGRTKIRRRKNNICHAQEYFDIKLDLGDGAE